MCRTTESGPGSFLAFFRDVMCVCVATRALGSFQFQFNQFDSKPVA